MSSQRQDYLLRQIELLRQFVARAIRKKPDQELEEALLLAFHLQEKLFPVPPAEFLQLELPEQIAALKRNESPGDGLEKCRSYAALLAETATLYQHKGLPDFAAGARQMSLYAALNVLEESPDDTATRDLARGLLERLDRETLQAPVLELLENVGL